MARTRHTAARFGLICALAAGLAAPAAAAPSAAQIRRAVRAAERSSGLWATVNICNTAAYPDTLGIRAQMPALGFAADLRMTFELDYFSQSKQAYEPLPGTADAVDLGTASKGTYQGGVRFRFRPRSGMFRGRTIFTWRLGHHTLARTTRLTTAGHRGARFANPPGYSRAGCVIG